MKWNIKLLLDFHFVRYLPRKRLYTLCYQSSILLCILELFVTTTYLLNQSFNIEIKIICIVLVTYLKYTNINEVLVCVRVSVLLVQTHKSKQALISPKYFSYKHLKLEEELLNTKKTTIVKFPKTTENFLFNRTIVILFEPKQNFKK